MRTTLLLSLFVGAVASSCAGEIGDSTPSVAISQIRLTVAANALTLPVGDSLLLNVAVTAANGAAYTLRYTSSNAAALSVTASGVVTALAAGSATVNITATLLDGSGSANASVNAAVTEEGPTLTLSNLPAATTTSTSASIGYTVSGNPSASVYCRRDTYDPGPCPNPFVLGASKALAAGRHTVDFYLFDGNPIDNTTTPTLSHEWVISSSTGTGGGAGGGGGGSSTGATKLPVAPLPAGAIVSGYDGEWTGANITDSSGTLLMGKVTDPVSGQVVDLHRILRSGASIWGGVRCEQAFDVSLTPGHDYWLAFAVMMPSQAEAITSSGPDDTLLVFQTHTPSLGNTTPDISLTLSGQSGKLNWFVAYNTKPSDTWSYVGGPNPDTENARSVYSAPLPAVGVWMRFVVHYRPGYQSSHNPVFEVWGAQPGTGYQQLFSHSGFNTYNSLSGPSYPRIGTYKWSDSVWNSASLLFYETPLYFAEGANLLEAGKAALDGL